jgi:hypothetical protein
MPLKIIFLPFTLLKNAIILPNYELIQKKIYATLQVKLDLDIRNLCIGLMHKKSILTRINIFLQYCLGIFNFDLHILPESAMSRVAYDFPSESLTCVQSICREARSHFSVAVRS